MTWRNCLTCNQPIQVNTKWKAIGNDRAILQGFTCEQCNKDNK